MVTIRGPVVHSVHNLVLYINLWFFIITSLPINNNGAYIAAGNTKYCWPSLFGTSMDCYCVLWRPLVMLCSCPQHWKQLEACYETMDHAMARSAAHPGFADMDQNINYHSSGAWNFNGIWGVHLWTTHHKIIQVKVFAQTYPSITLLCCQSAVGISFITILTIQKHHHWLNNFFLNVGGLHGDQFVFYGFAYM